MIEVNVHGMVLLFPRKTPLSNLRALGRSFTCSLKGKL